MIKYILGIALLALSMGACKNSSTGGAETTESGYDFKFLKDVDGPTAQPGEMVFFQLDMHDEQGNLLQSYRDMPQMPQTKMPENTAASKQQNPVIDLLFKCSEGDSVALFIPVDSMPARPPNIGESKIIEYRVTIEEIETLEDIAAKEAEAKAKLEGIQSLMDETLTKFKTNKFGADLKEGMGVQYVVHESVDGEDLEHGDEVKVHYYGTLYDGQMFDSSFKTGRAYPVTIGQTAVIEGWHNGLKQLKRGDKATLFIPFDQAYGAAGRPPRIPAKSDLAFYVEVK